MFKDETKFDRNRLHFVPKKYITLQLCNIIIKILVTVQHATRGVYEYVDLRVLTV